MIRQPLNPIRYILNYVSAHETPEMSENANEASFRGFSGPNDTVFDLVNLEEIVKGGDDLMGNDIKGRDFTKVP